VRRLGSSGVIVLLALMGWSTFGALRADAATVFVQEAFNGSTTASGHWTVPAAPSGNTNIACLTASGATAGTPIPGCQSTALDASGSGALRLTNTGGGEEGGVAYGLSIPTTQGIDATFDTYQYGSNSKADGIALFLAAVNPADPAPVAAIGQPGGSLGYAGSSSTGNGMVDGYLGLGLDVYGNYSNSGFDGSGCSLPSWPGWSGGAVADQVTVRGPGNGTLGYCLLNSTLATDDGGAVALQGSTSQTNDAARTAAEVPVEVVINPGSTTITTGSGLSVPAGDYEIAFTPIGGSRQTLAGPLPTTANGGIPSGLYPSTWMDSTTGLPYQLDFGWVGSTGGSTDIHEVNNVTAQSITTTEVPAFDASLTNSPSSVQPDQDLTYTAGVSLASSGNAESDQITVTDVFPTGETPLSAGLGGTNWTCGISGQTDTCTYALAGYPAGTALDALSLPVEVTAAGGSDVTNSFWVSSDDAVSNSATDTITVEAPPGAAATTTALTTGANPTTTGASTTLTATVSTASGTPTGTIDFEDDGTTINGCAAVALSSRVASCVTSFLASGGTPVPLTAVYSGSSSYQTSTGSLSQQVEGATPTISLIDSPSTLTSGESTTLTATVSTALTGVPAPTGTVEFESEASGGSYAVIGGCGAVAMNGSGVATCATSLLASGSVYHLEAVYSGDGNYVTVTSAALAQAVSKGTQTITFTSAYPSPAYYGNTYTVTATGGGSTSPVLFTSATMSVCTVTGSLVSFVGVGTCTIDANQAADANYNAASQALQSFTVSKELSSFTASASPTALAHGNQVTLSASGLAAGATGTVTFATGGTTWCTGTVSSGSASCTTAAAPAAGTQSVTATYGGDTDHAGSTAITSFTVTTDPVLVVSSSGTPAGATQGTSYSLTLNGAIGSSGGPAYNDPTLAATLPAGETFNAAPTASGWSCALSGSSSVLTCTSSAAPISAGTSLGSVTATVEISPIASGPLQAAVSLADSADQATPATTTATVDVTAPPVLRLTTSGTPVGAAAGTQYTVTLVPSLGGAPGGPAYDDPVLIATLPVGETFAAAPSVTGWSCSLSAGNALLTCTSTLATIVAGAALPDVSATVDISAEAPVVSLETEASLLDSADLATAATAAAWVDVTADPLLQVTTSGTPSGAAAGTTYSLGLGGSMGSAGGPAYSDPTLTASLPSGETFVSAPSVTGWTCALSGGSRVLTCISTAAPIAAGAPLAPVTVAVRISSGTSGDLQTAVALSDSADHATTATTAATVDVTVDPVLHVGASGTPSDAAAGTSYGLNLSSSIASPGGPAYNDPTLYATLPAGETFAAAPGVAGWSCSLSDAGLLLTCDATSAPIPAGTSMTGMTAIVDISAAASGSALQTVVALADGADAATTVSTTATVDVTAPPVLDLSTSGSPVGAAAGTSYNLTLSPSLGASPAGPAYNALTLTDTLPEGETLTGVSSTATWDCAYASGGTMLTCTSTPPTIPAGASLPQVIATVEISTAASGTLQTTALLTDSADAATPVTAEAAVEVTGPPLLEVGTSGTPAGAAAGTSYSLALSSSVGSAGGPAYNEPILTATLPSGETFAAAPAIGGWSCGLDVSSTVLTCTSSTPIPAGTALAGVTATVDISPAASADLQTTVSLSDAADLATPATATATVDVTSDPVLQIATSGSPAHAAAGTAYGLTLTPSLGASPAGPAYNDPTLSATLPAGETFAAAPVAGGWSCALNGGGTVLTCGSSSAPIAAGTALTPVTATVEIAFGAPLGSLETTAVLTDSGDGATAAGATATVDVTATPVLDLATTGTPSGAAAGSSYPLTLSPSLGPTPAGPAYNDPTLTAILPDGETFSGVPTPSGWSCALSGDLALLSCTSFSAPFGAGASLAAVTATVEISASASGMLSTTAVLTDSADAATPVIAEAAVDVTEPPVLEVGTSGTPAGAAAGTSYALTLSASVGSTGGPAYNEPVLTAILPSGETFAAAPAVAGWTCGLDLSATVLTCTSSSAPITAGTALAGVTATVDISPAASEDLQTAVSLTDTTDQAVTATATATVDVTADPVLQLSTSGTPPGAAVGTSYVLTLSPALAGSPAGPAFGDPILTATLPTGETFAGAPSASGWSCVLNGDGTVLTCSSTLAPIAAGVALAGVSATVMISSAAPSGSLEMVASLADEADAATAAGATASVSVTATPVLDLATSGTPSAAAAGSSYQLTLSPSLGGSPAGPAYSDPTLTASLPAGERFDAVPTATGWSCAVTLGDSLLTCTSTVAPISPGSILTDVTATVDIASTASGTLRTTASLADLADAATTISVTASVGVTATPVLDLATWGTPSTTAEGATYTLNASLALSPLGGPAYNEPTLSIVLPEGETFAAAPVVAGWSCSLSDGGTTLACTRTAATPVAAGALLITLTVQVDVSATASGELTTTIRASDSVDGAVLVATSATMTVPVETPDTGAPAGPPSAWWLGSLLLVAGFALMAVEVCRRRFGAGPHRT